MQPSQCAAEYIYSHVNGFAKINATPQIIRK